MTARQTCYALALLTVITLAVGIGTMRSNSLILLGAAEVLKLVSAGFAWRVAGQLAGQRLVGRMGAWLLFLAGLAGLIAIGAEMTVLGLGVTPLALTGLILTGIWGFTVGRASGSGLASGLGALLAFAGAATFFFPPAGMMAALVGLTFWLALGRTV